MFPGVLPEMILDDVRFQELVSEARTRIVRHSPAWTEHNVSDPGITLIELFAWLTEILSYRINRIPDRLHEALLELVGVRPAPPQQAGVDLRFILTEPVGAVIPEGTEVSAPRTAGGDLVVFRTDTELQVPALGLSGYAVQRGGETLSAPVHDGIAEPGDSAQEPFGRPPAVDDALLLGFAEPIGGLVVRLQLDCTLAEAEGAQSGEPGLRWETLGADGEWHQATVISDETGAFLLGGGAITVEVPSEAAPANLADGPMHWLRCRAAQGADGSDTCYRRGPSVNSVSAEVIGGVVRGHHAATVENELIGSSEGIAGASYRLRHHPVLTLGPGEVLEVREQGADEWVRWRPVESFSLSGPADRHFQIVPPTGELRFGPAIRQPDGGWRRYGAVPPAGAALRFSSYRYGGGTIGNVAARALSVVSPSLTGVAAATNPRPATGGMDPEPLEEARERARLEIRARTRAVTAEDFERLTVAASPEVARSICTSAQAGGAVRVHLLPRVDPADRQLELAELTPDEELMRKVATALERRRLLGTSIRLLPARLRGVSVVVDVRVSPLADLERVQQDVEHALYVYLNPLIGGSPTGVGNGWQAGRALNPGELFGIVYAIDGVEFVNLLRMYETDLVTGAQAPKPTETQLTLAADELISSGKHIVRAVYND